MSEQVLDRRRFLQIVRRHRKLVGIVAALGFLIGGAFAVLSPPMFTSKTLVVFPNSTPSIATQVVIATSNPVLSRALPDVSPAMSVDTLRTMVQAKGLTAYMISISAKGTTVAGAEASADAVANSYVAYITSGTGVISVAARIFQPATTATRTPLAERLLIDALIGAVCGALIGVVAAAAISRTDRQLRTRDEIANSIGLPVLASLPVGHPADASGWTKLLDGYRPGPTHAWWLRTALKELGVMGGNIGNGREDAGGSLAILSLESDPGALALGPQLAVFAASMGIVTALVIGPQQDATTTAALRTACAVPPPASSKRPSQLRVIVSDGGEIRVPTDSALTVLVVTLDDQAAKFPETMRTTTAVLGVSAGSASAEQLARVAVTAAADGREIAGVLVADPEPTDHSSGRIRPRPIRRGTTRAVHVPQRHSNGTQSADHSDQMMIFTARIGDGSSGPVTEIRR